MKIKICGITNLEDALVCSKYGVDMLGFVFYNKSKRYVDYKLVKSIISQLPKNIVSVGVFVDEDYSLINSISEEIGLKKIQLHGNESPDYVKKIKLPVIKAFRVSENFDWNKLNDYSNCEILLDTYSSETIGGTGKTFDWELIPDKCKHSIILSGGISINNIDKIMNEIKPAAIDVSSSIESYPGKKDHSRVIELLNAIKMWRT